MPAYRVGLLAVLAAQAYAQSAAPATGIQQGSQDETRSSVGQTDSSPSLTVGQLVNELMENNPALRAARFRFEAATKRPSQVGTLPEPKVSYTNFGVGHPFSHLNGSNFAYQGFGVSQSIPYPGKLALASEQARREAQSEEQMYRAAVLDAIARLKVAYYDWFYLGKAVEITEKDRDLMERFERIARARYTVGKGIQPDVLRAQVELSTLAQQLETFEQRRASVEAQINSLLDRPIDAPIGKPVEVKQSPLRFQLSDLLGPLGESSPDLRARQYQTESASVGIERAKKDFRPDFGVNFQWQHTGSRFPDYYMATAEVTVPVFFWRKQRYGLEEAEARLQESRQNYRATREQLLFNAKDQYLIAKSTERILALYESGIIPQASLSLEATISAYEVGTVDFLTLINNFQNLLKYEMQYYEELAKHEQALARLEPIVGQTLTQQ